MSGLSTEEYKELRKEITFLEDSIGKFYSNALTASVALLAGLGAFLLRNKIPANLNGER